MITAAAPTQVTATFDRYTICSVAITGDGCAPFNGPADQQLKVGMTVKLSKYRVRTDEVCERSPLASDVVTVSIPDLFGAAASDPLVATAINALVAAALSQAAKQNITIGTAS